jgi:tetratricopeptide (TPR) repeat protein
VAFRERPEEGRFPFAVCLQARGAILNQIARYEEAVGPLKEAADHFRAIARDPAMALRLAECLDALGVSLNALGRPAEASLAVQEATALR